ncbi:MULTISPECIES: hypothetical protein [unclassified Pseudomonas]|uniref:hypothetical protein n=1 Tax=unclassified Pseudomonas TaxID=196821 RepID=UPI0035B54D1F
MRRKDRGPAVLAIAVAEHPECIYAYPQVASMGLTETQARARGNTVKVGRFPFLANGKAIAMGGGHRVRQTGVRCQRWRVAGAHMVGRRGHGNDPGVRHCPHASVLSQK